jgi:FemAB-related protein (PEP-CTERM system-associated)
MRAHQCYDVTISEEVPAWQGYLRSHDDASVFHDPAWGRVMSAVYRNKAFYLTARRNDRIVGILQLVWQKSFLFGSHLSSIPYADAAGVLADDERARVALIQAAGDLRAELKADWVELRHRDSPAELPARTDKVTFGLALPADRDQLLAQFKSKLRSQVRKAMKEEFEILCGGGELLSGFYDIYSRTMRDLGSPPHSLRFFRAVLDAFPDATRLFAVRLDGKTVAASFTLADGQAVCVPWAAASRAPGVRNANMLLYWAMLSDAADRKATQFDFGRCSINSGTWRFKRQWGGTQQQLHWHYLLPDGATVPEQRPDSRKYRALVACWKRLPVALARRIGPRIIRGLS